MIGVGNGVLKEGYGRVNSSWNTMWIESGTIKPKELVSSLSSLSHSLILLLLRVFFLASFIATLLINPQINLLLVLALLVCMSQLRAFAGKITMIISTLVQIDKNISTSISPLQRDTGILEILLGDCRFCGGRGVGKWIRCVLEEDDMVWRIMGEWRWCNWIAEKRVRYYVTCGEMTNSQSNKNMTTSFANFFVYLCGLRNTVEWLAIAEIYHDQCGTTIIAYTNRVLTY